MSPADNGPARASSPTGSQPRDGESGLPSQLRPGGLQSRTHSRISQRNDLEPIISRRELNYQAPTSVQEDQAKGSNSSSQDQAAMLDARLTPKHRSIRARIKAAMERSREARRARKRKKMGRASWKESFTDSVLMLWQKLIIQGVFRQFPLQPSKNGRHVPLNPDADEVGVGGLADERRHGKPYILNTIRSSRYTIWDFYPRQVLYQFSKLGNFYFLCMGILTLIPGLSTVGRFTTIAPLAAFVTISMAKEGYDDFRRYQLDKSENRSTATVLKQGVRHDGVNPSLKGLEKQAKKVARAAKNEKPSVSGNESVNDVPLEDLELGDSERVAGAYDWMKIQWQDVRVGDVIRLKRDDDVPADLILLSATGPNNVAYIETMALDGETNLKAKQALSLLAERCSTMEGLKTTKATIVSEDPNIDLYHFDGKATVDGETLPLTLTNIVYRGSTLRNTSEAIGLVINSGEECKIRMNANRNVHAKKPAMQSMINRIILVQMFIVMMLGAGLTIGYSLWQSNTEEKSWYLYTRGLFNAAVPYDEIYFGFVIMFNTLIPISLYIAMEVSKIGQLILLQDPDMYDPKTDTPMVANTTTILEDLGQIGHIFSDKTGTLTENLMRFRKMSVAGVALLHDADPADDSKDVDHESGVFSSTDIKVTEDSAHEKRPSPSRLASQASISLWKSTVHPDGVPEMNTTDMLEYIQSHPDTPFSRKAKQLILCIALCHTCLPEHKDDGKIAFQASSPDELALVEAAQDFGYLMIDRPADSIKIQSKGAEGALETEIYQVLDVIEFSSKRKRMSIIIRMPDGRVCIFCKGADDAITARLRLRQLAEQKAREAGMKQTAVRVSEQGKRMSRHTVSAQNSPRPSLSQRFSEVGGFDGRSPDLTQISHSDEVASYFQRKQRGTLSAGALSPRSSFGQLRDDRATGQKIDEGVAENEGAIFERCYEHLDDFASEGLRTLLYAYRYIDEDMYVKWKEEYKAAETSLHDRAERMEELSEGLEKQFELAGATAIEDKLQEGVPETIDKFRRANVKVWMLTGDKRETAINIGHSAHLCKAYSEVFILDKQDGDLHGSLTSMLNEVSRGMLPHTVLVVDGQTLAVIDDNEDLGMLFYDLSIRVDAVICCRASPSQKALLVQSMRRYVPDCMTLAIGDGANDIGMIQAASVGIGISGREGLQAARVADFSIAQFRFLQKLLLVHGRWNYMRTGKYVRATFWKEMIFYLINAQFQGFNGYTGTSMFENWSLTIFNAIFTSLPVVILCIFEKDLEAETLLAAPELYVIGQEGGGLNVFLYLGWMIMAISGNFIIYYFTWLVYDGALFDIDASLYAYGLGPFTVAVVFINIKLLVLELHSKTYVALGGFLLSFAVWFFWNLAIGHLYSATLSKYLVWQGIYEHFGQQLVWWTTILLCLASLTTMELVVQSLRRVYLPTDTDLMQRIEQDPVAKKRLEAAAARAERGETKLLDMGAIRVSEKKKSRNLLGKRRNKGEQPDTIEEEV